MGHNAAHEGSVQAPKYILGTRLELKPQDVGITHDRYPRPENKAAWPIVSTAKRGTYDRFSGLPNNGEA